MFVGPEAQAGTGGLDGDAPNLGLIEMSDTDDAAKITYFTPRVAGFQLGASFTPDFEEPGPPKIAFRVAVTRARTASAAAPTGWARWARWISRFPAWCCGRTADPTAPTIRPALGQLRRRQLNYGVASCSASAASRSAPATSTAMPFQALQVDIANVGLKYGFGAAHVSVGYNYNKADDNDIDDAHIFVVSGDVGILPGVVLKGDVAYNTDDIGACEGGATECPAPRRQDVGNNQDDTIGGVVSVQFNY